MDINQITEKIIGCAYKVSNTTGVGFLEKVYENALTLELNKIGLRVKQQSPVKVVYESTVIGEYLADLIVEDIVMVELKTVDKLNDSHFAQCMNYLRATGMHLCLLLNFGTRHIGIKRVANNLKE